MSRDKKSAEPLARAQCEAPTAPRERDADYNLWWGESSSAKRRKREEERDVASATKCDPARDSGKTKGGRGADTCLFFAKGCCHLGWRCDRQHRVPAVGDAEPPNELDVFGRRRDCDDGDGTRQFGRNNAVRANRTLWIGHCAADEAAVRDAFADFGVVERARAVPSKKCVFVTMATRAQAEFSKEAMERQTVGGSALLSVIRWAQDDPHPGAARSAAAEHATQVLDAARPADGFVPAARAAPLPPLADGWSAAVDAASGHTYYYAADGAVTWDRPVAAAAVAPPAPAAAAPPISLVAYSSDDDDD